MQMTAQNVEHACSHMPYLTTFRMHHTRDTLLTWYNAATSSWLAGVSGPLALNGTYPRALQKVYRPSQLIVTTCQSCPAPLTHCSSTRYTPLGCAITCWSVGTALRRRFLLRFLPVVSDAQVMCRALNAHERLIYTFMKAF